MVAILSSAEVEKKKTSHFYSIISLCFKFRLLNRKSSGSRYKTSMCQQMGETPRWKQGDWEKEWHLLSYEQVDVLDKLVEPVLLLNEISDVAATEHFRWLYKNGTSYFSFIIIYFNLLAYTYKICWPKFLQYKLYMNKTSPPEPMIMFAGRRSIGAV